MKLIFKIIKMFFIRMFKCRFWLFKKMYYFQPFIYVDKDGNLIKDYIGDRVKWLNDDMVIKDFCYDDASKKAFNVLNKKHEKYKGYIWLF